VLVALLAWAPDFSLASAALCTDPLADLDLTTSTDFEDLAAVGGDLMEFVEQDRLLVSDGGLEAGLGLGAPLYIHTLRSRMRPTLSARPARRPIRVSRTPRLCGCPQARGLVIRVCIMNPKKPNSAMRHVAKVRLYGKPRVTARIPGRGFGVSKFNRCLVRGGRANDLPGVGYTLVRGVYDFSPLFGKKRRRSFYGVPRPSARPRFLRRCLRRGGVSRLRAGSYPAQLGASPRPHNARRENPG
jgi:small subunit ribosomal protein S12